MSVLLPFSILGAPGDDALDVADVFSTDLYTGNGSTQSITNGVDLAGEGGLVWVKARAVAGSHGLIRNTDGDELSSNGTGAEITTNAGFQFNSDGFGFTSSYAWSGYSAPNESARSYVGWSFRIAPGFHDVVTYTGDGTTDGSHQINHSLGVSPGLIIIKRTDSTDPWIVHHRQDFDEYLNLNNTNAATTSLPNSRMTVSSEYFAPHGGGPTGTITNNFNGDTYVAYLFAHDTSDSGIIQCGSYTGNGSASGPTVTLGWEPQWVLIKDASGTNNWFIFDAERTAFRSSLNPNTSSAESTPGSNWVTPGSSGFQITSATGDVNTSARTYIYMAIRAEGA